MRGSQERRERRHQHGDQAVTGGVDARVGLVSEGIEHHLVATALHDRRADADAVGHRRSEVPRPNAPRQDRAEAQARRRQVDEERGRDEHGGIRDDEILDGDALQGHE